MDPSDEKRGGKRQSVLKTAKIMWGSSVVDCLYQVPESLTPGVFKAAVISFNVANG